MSETVEPVGKKGRGKTRAGGIRSGLRGWNASTDGAALSRTSTCETPEQAAKLAQRAITAFQKAAAPLELRLEGTAVTLRVDVEGGRVDDKVKKLAKRFGPKDPARKAARKAARAQAGAAAE